MLPVDPLLAAVTAAALIFYLVTLGAVGAARARHKVDAPAMSGPPGFERALRVQANTLEGLIVFLPALWLFAAFFDTRIAAGLGALWIVGRIAYMVGYLNDPKKREIGFGIQALATVILLLGALAGAGMALIGA